MTIRNDKVDISIVGDSTYTIDSVDNKPYDFVLNPANFTRNDYTSAFSITVDNEDKQVVFILIGSCFSTASALLEDDNLIVLMNNDIFVINYLSFHVVKHKHYGDFFSLFSIEKFCDGYIIHGEMDIVMLTTQFDVKWSFSGADIFATLNGNSSFDIVGDKILLEDWLGNKYCLDKNGKEIYFKDVLK